MYKKKYYHYVSIILLTVFLFFSPICSFCSSAGFLTPGEYWNAFKNTMSYIGTQIGTVFSGSAQDMILNEQAFKEWAADRYANGYDGTSWNLEDYYTKECIRNPDGTFTLSDRLVDDCVAWIKEVLDTNSGYYLVKTKGLNNVSPAEFRSKTNYNNFLSLFDSADMVFFYSVSSTQFPDEGYVPYVEYFILDGYDFVFTSYSVSSGLYNQFSIYDDWQKVKTKNKRLHDNGVVHDSVQIENLGLDQFVTKNGDYIKFFKNDAAMKEFDVGFQPYYVGDKYLNYDSSQDNSITVDSNILNNNWVTNNNQIYNETSNTVINNNTTNITNGGSGLTEEQIKDIVDSVLDKYKPDSGGSDSGDGGGSGSGDNGGGGLTAILEALGKLLDFLLTLIGKLLSVILDFLTKALGLLEGLTAFTGPFATLLSGLMPFVPSELWDVIIAGITLSVIAVVIKAWKG